MPTSKKRKKSTNPGASQGEAPQAKVVIHRSTYTTMAGVAVALGLVGWMIFGGSKDATIQVIVPELSPVAQKGQVTFERVCLRCHGLNVAGSKNGPPLVDPFYRPSHHTDAAFINAITRGARQHHWKFGAMPPQPGVKASEITELITYIREIQQANGVF
jgi:mono/diheme cytochrome c family protein